MLHGPEGCAVVFLNTYINHPPSHLDRYYIISSKHLVDLRPNLTCLGHFLRCQLGRLGNRTVPYRQLLVCRLGLEVGGWRTDGEPQQVVSTTPDLDLVL